LAVELGDAGHQRQSLSGESADRGGETGALGAEPREGGAEGLALRGEPDDGGGQAGRLPASWRLVVSSPSAWGLQLGEGAATRLRWEVSWLIVVVQLRPLGAQLLLRGDQIDAGAR